MKCFDIFWHNIDYCRQNSQFGRPVANAAAAGTEGGWTSALLLLSLATAADHDEGMHVWISFSLVLSFEKKRGMHWIWMFVTQNARARSAHKKYANEKNRQHFLFFLLFLFLVRQSLSAPSGRKLVKEPKMKWIKMHTKRHTHTTTR